MGHFFPSYSLVVALSAAGHWQKGKNVFVLCAIWIYHVPIIIFEAELIESGFFQGIDVIIPIPLHETKQRIRGYNQSEWIARGIAAVTGIPVDTEAVVRRKYTETQTRKSIFERWENVEGIFELHHAESLIGKHVLIVDDVLTTGATTVACASRIMEVEGIRISVLTLAVAD